MRIGRMRLAAGGCFFLAVAVLPGCAVETTPTPALESVAQVFSQRVQTPAIPAQPDARYRYLRVEVDGHPPGMLALGYLDHAAQGVVEVWYSASGEVLRTLNGRIVGTVGLQTDWASVRLHPLPPVWDALLVDRVLNPAPLVFTRVRSVMPGYRFDVTEAVQLSRVGAALPRALLAVLPPTLPESLAAHYQWFHESYVDASAANATTESASALPDSWFAWGRHRGVAGVVFSYQCLAPDFCLKLQRWPVQEEFN